MDELTRLFLAARDGDRMALTEAIRASEADVWRFAAHLVGPAEADDVTQDTFLRAWRALPDYRGDGGARTWLLTIARRAAADAIRRNQRGRRIVDRARAEAMSTPFAEAGDHTTSDLEDLLTTLDADQRSAFVLTQVLGFSYAETAEICGVRIGTIRSRVSRARGVLVEHLRTADAGLSARDEAG